MDLKLCPRCKQLPTANIRKRLIGYECCLHCGTLGCKLYWPIVVDGWTKDATMHKAAERWNKAVDEY